MPADPRQVDREAADWFLLLTEEPDDAAVGERFETWLEADPIHADAWARISAAGNALAAAPVEQWDKITPNRALPASRNAAGRRRWPKPRRWRFAVGAAAAAALAFVFLPSAALYFRADHMTGTAQIESIRLADGSTVQLGPDSAVAVNFESGQRNVRLLAGQAWFEVEPDPNHPFRVTAGHVSTTVLGTGFEVRRLASATAVGVAHGRVRVSDDTASPPTSHELTAGQWVSIAQDHATRQGTGNAAAIGAWRQGRLLVRNRTIADVIEDVRPWYKGRILLTDSSLGQRRVTGYYDLHDPAVTLESLVAPDGGRLMRITPWLIIVSAR